MLRRMFSGAVVVAIASCALVLMGANAAMAGLGQPTDGQLGLQLPATPLMEQLRTLYDMVNWIIIAIALFVLALLIYVIFRFRESANPTPSRTTHHTGLEVAWTIIPIFILVAMAIPSFRLLYDQYSFPKPDVTIKATGMSWAWEHSYLDQGFAVSSNVISDEDVLRAKIGDDAFDEKYGSLEGVERTSAVYEASRDAWAERGSPRKLTVDNEIAVPVNKVVHLLVTSADVIHSWTIPSFGVKMQAVPGRTAATWFKATKTGVFYGQCSVLCGKFHSAMPIAVRVVEEPVYNSWVEALKAGEDEKANEILKTAAAKQSLEDKTNVAAVAAP